MPDDMLTCMCNKSSIILSRTVRLISLFVLGRDVLVLIWSVQAVLLCSMPRGTLVMTCRRFAGTIMRRL